jgi:murein DD-endopeptidase MepM/ murein hydrolase activator NlpD
VPAAPVNEEARKQNGNLPGMGGVFNVVNLHLYHYAGNNPVKYTDPDGRTDEDTSSEIYNPEVIQLPGTPRPLPSNFAVWPIVGTGGEGKVSDPFGYGDNPMRQGAIRHHGGVDIAVPIGTEVVSVMDGTVASVGNDRVYGNFIEIDHDNDASTKYGHLNELPRLIEGQSVQRGTIIGFSGSTGMSTGPHLHFEYKINGEKKNPFDSLFTQGIFQLRRP